MRISELSAETGVAVATIKFYLREGLLPAGERTSANQANYGTAHAQRVRLIRALIEVGGLSIATAREVLAAVDTPELPVNLVFRAAQHAVSEAGLYEPAAEEGSGAAKVRAVIERRGWHVDPDNPGRHGAARVLDAYERAGHPELAEIWDGYAEGAELVAKADIAALGLQSDLTAMAETVVVGTVLGDALFSSLRRIAQEHISSEHYPTTEHRSRP